MTHDMEDEAAQHPLSAASRASTNAYREEVDAFGTVQIPSTKYWGAQTQRATQVFNVGHEFFPPALVHTFALQKIAAARANHRLGCLESSVFKLIVQAAEELRQGRFDDHFPLTVWQTGSGTQTNMNVNEIIANYANELAALTSTDRHTFEHRQSTSKTMQSERVVHPNDHVNCSQSSNDSFPTVMHIITLLQLSDRLEPSLKELQQILRGRAESFAHIIKIGRTHLMDAVPMTLGQSFDAFDKQIGHHIERLHDSLNRLRELPQGGTAVGSGINTPPDFDRLFCEELNKLTFSSEHLPDHDKFVPAASKFESMGAHDALVEVSSVLNGLAVTLLKMATDIRFLCSGPRCGLDELILPSDGLTSSIMPGKINPTIAEMISQIAFQVMGNHTTVTTAAAAASNFELNVAKPVIIYNILQSIDLLADGMTTFGRKLIAGLEANEGTLRQNTERALLQVTALNPIIGYDKVSKIVKKALEMDSTPREAAVQLGYVSGEEYDRVTSAASLVADVSREP
jgi:fumarate hydratase, class II